MAVGRSMRPVSRVNVGSNLATQYSIVAILTRAINFQLKYMFARKTMAIELCFGNISRQSSLTLCVLFVLTGFTFQCWPLYLYSAYCVGKTNNSYILQLEDVYPQIFFGLNLKPSFMKLDIFQCHANPKIGQLPVDIICMYVN